MLYWHFRNFQCMFLSLFKKPMAPTEVVTKSFWANVFDADWFHSIQAGRFFTYTDAARWELAARIGFYKYVIKNKWVIILGGQKIIYRRPVKIFRKFTITMQITGWDDKWMYAAHAFRQSGQVCCVSFTKIGLRARGSLFSPVEALKMMGHNQVTPPAWVIKHFQEDLETLKLADQALI